MPGATESLPSLTIEEVGDLYPNQWIILKATELDERQRIIRGQVLSHSRSTRKFRDGLERVRHEQPLAPIYIFVGGERRLTGPEAREVIARAAKEDYVNARW